MTILQKQKPAFWAGSLNSGARTRTNAVSVEQRACRAGPEGVSRWRRIIERSSMKSPFRQKQKPAFWAGSLNSGAGLGIDVLFYFYDLQSKFLI